MPTPTTAPSAKRYAGWAVETTQGTPVTPNTWTQPLENWTADPKIVQLDDKSLRGSMTSLAGVIQGPKSSEISMNGPAFLDGLGFLLDNILGDLTTTGPVSSSYNHEFSVLNSGTGQPGSLTFVAYNGLTPTSGAKMYPGLCLSELVLKGNPESTLIEFSAKGMAWAEQDYPTAAPVNTPTSASPLAAWRVGIDINDVANLTIREWQVTITRQLAVQVTSQNSQNPYIIQRGALTVAGTLFFAKPADDTPLDYFLNNTQPEINIHANNGGAGAALLGLGIHCQVAAFDSANFDYSDPAVAIPTSFRGVDNATDAGASGGLSPVMVTLDNAITTY